MVLLTQENICCNEVLPFQVSYSYLSTFPVMVYLFTVIIINIGCLLDIVIPYFLKGGALQAKRMYLPH